MDADPKAAVANSEDDPPSRRRGIGLCLSGGGFRATLFHLGAIRRLFELGITARPDFDTIASVSDGSLKSAQGAQWAIALLNAKVQNTTVDFQADIASPLQALTATNIRSGAMAKKYLLPWNWLRRHVAVEAMISRLEAAFPFKERIPDHLLEPATGCPPLPEQTALKGAQSGNRRTILGVETPGTPMTLVYGDGVFKPQGPLPVDLKNDDVVHVVIVDEARGTAVDEDDPTGWKALDKMIGIIKDAPPDMAENHDFYLDDGGSASPDETRAERILGTFDRVRERMKREHGVVDVSSSVREQREARP